MKNCHSTVGQIKLSSYRGYQSKLDRGKRSFVTASPRFSFLSFEKLNFVASDGNPVDICSRSIPAGKSAYKSLW